MRAVLYGPPNWLVEKFSAGTGGVMGERRSVERFQFAVAVAFAAGWLGCMLFDAVWGWIT